MGTIELSDDENAYDDSYDSEEDHDDRYFVLPADGNVSASVLAKLPISTQYTVMQQQRDHHRLANITKFAQVAEDTSQFSQLQMHAFLKTCAFSKQIEQLRVEMNESTTMYGVPTRRIASEANREYIYVKHKTDEEKKSSLASLLDPEGKRGEWLDGMGRRSSSSAEGKYGGLDGNERMKRSELAIAHALQVAHSRSTDDIIGEDSLTLALRPALSTEPWLCEHCSYVNEVNINERNERLRNACAECGRVRSGVKDPLELDPLAQTKHLPLGMALKVRGKDSGPDQNDNKRRDESKGSLKNTAAPVVSSIPTPSPSISFSLVPPPPSISPPSPSSSIPSSFSSSSPSLDPSSSSPPASGSGKPAPWQCITCTFLNTNTTIRCEMCAYPRDPSAAHDDLLRPASPVPSMLNRIASRRHIGALSTLHGLGTSESASRGVWEDDALLLKDDKKTDAEDESKNGKGWGMTFEMEEEEEERDSPSPQPLSASRANNSDDDVQEIDAVPSSRPKSFTMVNETAKKTTGADQMKSQSHTRSSDAKEAITITFDLNDTDVNDEDDLFSSMFDAPPSTPPSSSLAPPKSSHPSPLPALSPDPSPVKSAPRAVIASASVRRSMSVSFLEADERKREDVEAGSESKESKSPPDSVIPAAPAIIDIDDLPDDDVVQDGIWEEEDIVVKKDREVVEIGESEDEIEPNISMKDGSKTSIDTGSNSVPAHASSVTAVAATVPDNAPSAHSAFPSLPSPFTISSAVSTNHNVTAQTRLPSPVSSSTTETLAFPRVASHSTPDVRSGVRRALGSPPPPPRQLSEMSEAERDEMNERKYASDNEDDEDVVQGPEPISLAPRNAIESTSSSSPGTTLVRIQKTATSARQIRSANLFHSFTTTANENAPVDSAVSVTSSSAPSIDSSTSIDVDDEMQPPQPQHVHDAPPIIDDSTYAPYISTPHLDGSVSHVSASEAMSFNDHLSSAYIEQRNLAADMAQQKKGEAYVTEDMIADSKRLLQLMGIPYVVAPAEAEAQCAALELLGLVDGVVTDDSDVFLFGATHVYRHMFADGKKYAERYDMNDIVRILGLDRTKLVSLAMLLGSDYTTGVKGVGIVNAMEIVMAFPGEGDGESGLREWREWVYSAEPNAMPNPPALEQCEAQEEKEAAVAAYRKAHFKYTHRNIRTTWGVSTQFPNREAMNGYWKPFVDDSEESFTWGSVDVDGLRSFCDRKLMMKEDEFNRVVGPVLESMSTHRARQSHIDRYFSPDDSFAAIASERLQRAVKGLTRGKKKKTTNGEEVVEEEVPLEKIIEEDARAAKAKKPRRTKSGPANSVNIPTATPSTATNPRLTTAGSTGLPPLPSAPKRRRKRVADEGRARDESGNSSSITIMDESGRGKEGSVAHVVQDGMLSDDVLASMVLPDAGTVLTEAGVGGNNKPKRTKRANGKQKSSKRRRAEGTPPSAPSVDVIEIEDVSEDDVIEREMALIGDVVEHVSSDDDWEPMSVRRESM